MKQAVIHVRSKAAGKIKREKREGRETIVLPSFAAKAESVLNGILYPREELEKSLAGLNKAPAPFGHPTINGKFVPALDPEALARNYIFAWNENPRWDGDRIALDVVIDEARAKESESGKRVLNAIEEKKPIGTSTGLLCNLEQVNADTHKAVARNIQWDHVAILMDEEPAITPDQGVGIFVNSASEDADEIEVINSSLSEEAERGLDWAIEHLAQALERRERASWLEQFKTAIMKLIPGSERATTTTNTKDDDMDKVQFDELSKKVDALSESLKPDALATAIGNAVATAIKPLTEAHEAVLANQKAKDEAELADLQAKIVKANLLDEDAAKELTLNAARALAKKAEPGKAAALNGAFKPSGDKPGFKLPAAEKEA